MMHLFTMFDGPSGKVSSMRVGTTGIAFMVTGTWAMLSITKGELQPWTPEMVGLVVGCLGMKAAQRKLEQANQDKEQPK